MRRHTLRCHEEDQNRYSIKPEIVHQSNDFIYNFPFDHPKVLDKINLKAFDDKVNINTDYKRSTSHVNDCPMFIQKHQTQQSHSTTKLSYPQLPRFELKKEEWVSNQLLYQKLFIPYLCRSV